VDIPELGSAGFYKVLQGSTGFGSTGFGSTGFSSRSIELGAKRRLIVARDICDERLIPVAETTTQRLA
jgi:hypothetical protein